MGRDRPELSVTKLSQTRRLIKFYLLLVYERATEVYQNITKYMIIYHKRLHILIKSIYYNNKESLKMRIKGVFLYPP